MSWAEVKKINSNLDKPLDELLDEVVGELNELLDEVVGDNADPASASGSVHGKLKDVKNRVDTLTSNIDLTLPKNVFVSDTVIISNDAEKQMVGNNTYKLAKEIFVNLNGTVRVTFQYALLVGSTDTSYWLLTRNNVSDVIFDSGTYKSPAWTTHTSDVRVDAGDAIQVWCKAYKSSNIQGVRNFRVMGTVVTGSTQNTVV
jgi:hypothetical protein